MGSRDGYQQQASNAHRNEVVLVPLERIDPTEMRLARHASATRVSERQPSKKPLMHVNLA